MTGTTVTLPREVAAEILYFLQSGSFVYPSKFSEALKSALAAPQPEPSKHMTDFEQDEYVFAKLAARKVEPQPVKQADAWQHHPCSCIMCTGAKP